MKSKKEFGDLGEQLALEFLQEKNYRLLKANYFYQKVEVDLIMEFEDQIVFVEVKTRSYDDLNAPEDAVNTIKKSRIIEAANHYIESHDIDKEARFDIISIVLGGHKKSIRHIEDAFNSIY